MKAVLRLGEIRRKREERYEQYMRPLDRKRDVLAADVDLRMRALIGTQQAEAKVFQTKGYHAATVWTLPPR